MRLQNAIRRAEAQERGGTTGRGRGRPAQVTAASSSQPVPEPQQRTQSTTGQVGK